MEDKVEREGIILGELVGIVQYVLIIFIHLQVLPKSPYSLGPPYWGKSLVPSPTCLTFSSKPGGNLSKGKLLQLTHPSIKPCKLPVPLCPQTVLFPQPQWNSKTQATISQ